MRRVVALVVGALVLGALLAAPAQAKPDRHPRVTPCSRGLVALTFDDGPSATVRPKLVRLLRRLDVPATFFMVGSRVASAPETARLVERAGVAIGNHTWEHTDLTTQSDAEIRKALRSTHREMVEAGLHPTRLARPPYGAVNDRVRGVLADLALVPVLWTIDSRDWAGGTPRQVLHEIYSEVHPHGTNVVLQHDGVTNSPATLRALPEEIATLRERGFCFAEPDAQGNPTPPVPVPSVSTDVRRVDEGGQQVTLTAGASSTSITVRDLDGPPQVRVVGASVTASPLVPTQALVGVRLDHVSGRDVRVLLRTPAGPIHALVPAGRTSAVASVPVPVGRVDQPVRRLAVAIGRVDNATAGRSATVTVRPPWQTREQAISELAQRVEWPVVVLPMSF